MRHGVTRKRSTERLQHTGNLFRKNFRNKRCLLILQLKLLRSQVKGKHSVGREFQSLAVQRKKLLTYPCNVQEWRLKNHAIYQNNEYTSLEEKEVEPVEPVLKNICQSNTYRKDLFLSLAINDEKLKNSIGKGTGLKKMKKRGNMCT